MPSDPADRNLIPQGLPYGERQATVDAMQQAGLPLGTGQPPTGPQAFPTQVPTGPGDDPAEDLASFDALTVEQPTLPPTTLTPPEPAGPNWVDAALASPNPILRSLAERIKAARG